MASDNLKITATRAAGFRLVGNVGATVLTLVLGIVLARLLPPAEFGLFGLAAALVVIAEVVGGCGMLEAVVQRPVVLHEHEAAAAWVQLAAATLLGALLALSADPVAAAFDMDGLAPILRLQSLVLPLTALALVPITRMTRRLQFGRLAVVDVCTGLLTGISAIVLALRGFGAIALVYGALAGAVTRLLAVWLLDGGRPVFRFSFSHVKDLYAFGVGMMGISIANIFARRVDVLIIGATLGSSVVGLYQRAFQLLLVPFEQVIGPINKVLFPALASVSADRARVQRGYLAVTRLSALVGFPIMMLIVAVGDLVVSVVYGPMWVEAGPLLQLLAVSGFFRILFKTHGVLVQAKGEPGAEAVRQVVYLALVAGLAWLGSRFGIVGVVLGVVTAAFVFCMMMTRLALELADVSTRAWLATLRSGLAASVLMALAVVTVRALAAGAAEWIVLAVACATAAASYAGATRLLMGNEDRAVLADVIDTLPQRVRGLSRAVVGAYRAAEPASRGVA